MKRKQPKKQQVMKRITCRFSDDERDWEKFEGSVLSDYPTDLYDLDDRVEEPATLVFYGWDAAPLRDWFSQPELCAGVRLKEVVEEDLSEREWKRIKKEIESELEPPGDVEELLEKLRHPVAEKRQEAAEALMMQAERAAQAVPALIESLSDPRVRIMAAKALGHIGEAARPAIPALLRMLGESKSHWEFSAARSAVQNIGVAPDVILPVLRGLLSAADPAVRSLAALSVGCLGEAARADVPRLVALLKDPSSEVRENVAMGLGEMGAIAFDSVAALREALQDENEEVRKYAEKALRAIQGTKGSWGQHSSDASKMRSEGSVPGGSHARRPWPPRLDQITSSPSREHRSGHRHSSTAP